MIDVSDVLHSVRVLVFFFQAEDGIRDLVRSRGLGDVYKRQQRIRPQRREHQQAADFEHAVRFGERRQRVVQPVPVSYTHLTLPTIYSV